MQEERRIAMKNVVVVALLCLNAALLVALVFEAGTPPAQGQIIGGGTNYLMMTGKIGTDYDALYVVDLAKQRLIMWRYDHARKHMVKVARRDFTRDFGIAMGRN